MVTEFVFFQSVFLPIIINVSTYLSIYIPDFVSICNSFCQSDHHISLSLSLPFSFSFLLKSLFFISHFFLSFSLFLSLSLPLSHSLSLTLFLSLALLLNDSISVSAISLTMKKLYSYYQVNSAIKICDVYLLSQLRKNKSGGRVCMRVRVCVCGGVIIKVLRLRLP